MAKRISKESEQVILNWENKQFKPEELAELRQFGLVKETIDNGFELTRKGKNVLKLLSKKLK